MSGYPVTLVYLAHTPCLVVGGGQVAARKVAALREGGVRPTVISPAWCDALWRQVEDGEIDAIQRQNQAGDQAGI